MFRTNPEFVVNTLLEILDAKKTRLSVKKATQELVDQGLDLGPNPESALSSILALVKPSVLNIRSGKGGGVGRPTEAKTPSQKKGNGLVSLMRQAIKQGRSVEEVRAQLLTLTGTES